MNKKFFVTLIVAILIIGFSVGSYIWSWTSERPNLSPASVQTGNIAETVRITGSIQPETTAELGFEKAGRITELDAAVGDHVKAGQVLARVDDLDTAAQEAQALAQVDQASAVLKEYQEKTKADKYLLEKVEKESTHTYQDTMIQRKQVDADNALMAAQQAAIQAAQQNLTYNQIQVSKATIVAPFSGIISAKNNEVGDVVASAAPVYTLITGNDYKIEAYASEADVSKIKPGDPAEVDLQADGSESGFQTQVVSVDPAAVMENGVPSYKVTLKFSGDSATVKVGDSVDVTITTAQKNDAMIVPAQDVITKNGKSYVTVSELGLPVLKEVQTGIASAAGQVEIISGLTDGQKILSVNAQ